jgi:hypothetical protein
LICIIEMLAAPYWWQFTSMSPLPPATFGYATNTLDAP